MVELGAFYIIVVIQLKVTYIIIIITQLRRPNFLPHFSLHVLSKHFLEHRLQLLLKLRKLPTVADLFVRLPAHPELAIPDDQNSQLLHLLSTQLTSIEWLEQLLVRVYQIHANYEIVGWLFVKLEFLEVLERFRSDVVAVEEPALKMSPIILALFVLEIGYGHVVD